MGERTTTILSAVCIFLVTCCAWGQNTADSNSATTGDSAVEIARFENDYSTARLQPALLDGKAGIAVIFEGTDDMHYYARAETGPGIGFELQVKPSSDVFGFGPAVFPKWHIFVDSTDARVEVYSGNFVVFLPIETTKAPTKTTTIDKGDVEVKITGAVCTSMICIVPDVTTLRTSIDLSQSLSWEKITLELPTDADESETARVPAYSVWFALGLALLAGLALNIMPCVWPILPIIVMKIISQAKKDKRTSVTMGLAFCIGILLFFACLAGTNIILQSFYDKTLSWGDHLRNPVIVTALAMLIIVMALFMFGVFTITVPSSIAGKSGSGKGHAGSVAMGFLAAVLSTPCSFGILTVAFVWAQGQTLPLGTLAIMVIGIGMAVPYAILTSIPGLLKRLPKAGRWIAVQAIARLCAAYHRGQINQGRPRCKQGQCIIFCCRSQLLCLDVEHMGRLRSQIITQAVGPGHSCSYCNSFLSVLFCTGTRGLAGLQGGPGLNRQTRRKTRLNQVHRRLVHQLRSCR